MSLSLSNSLSFALILLVKIEEEEIQKMITIMIEVSVAMMMRTTEMMIMAHIGEEGGRAGRGNGLRLPSIIPTIQPQSVFLAKGNFIPKHFRKMNNLQIAIQLWSMEHGAKSDDFFDKFLTAPFKRLMTFETVDQSDEEMT